MVTTTCLVLAGGPLGSPPPVLVPLIVVIEEKRVVKIAMRYWAFKSRGPKAQAATRATEEKSQEFQQSCSCSQ